MLVRKRGEDQMWVLLLVSVSWEAAGWTDIATLKETTPPHRTPGPSKCTQENDGLICSLNICDFFLEPMEFSGIPVYFHCMD